MAPLIIPLSKRRIVLVALGAAGFVALGVFLFLNADAFSRRSPLVTRSVAVACVVFFGWCAVYASRKLIDSAPGLVIDSHGIFDNSSGVAAGLIPWTDITGFKVTTLHKQRFLTIEVRNPEQYIQRTSGLRRHFVAMNAKHFGGPIQISVNTLKMPFDDLVKSIAAAHAKYGAA